MNFSMASGSCLCLDSSNKAAAAVTTALQVTQKLASKASVAALSEISGCCLKFIDVCMVATNWDYVVNGFGILGLFGRFDVGDHFADRFETTDRWHDMSLASLYPDFRPLNNPAESSIFAKASQPRHPSQIVRDVLRLVTNTEILVQTNITTDLRPR